MNVKEASLSAVFASLYVVINILQTLLVGNPSIYGPIQLRVADCLIALSALFGSPVAVGVSFGGLLTNAYYFLDPLDVVFGPIANLLAAIAIMAFRKHRLLACIIGALPIGIIVGGYLWLFFQPPDIFGLALPVWAAMMISITLSSWISIAILGYSILTILSRPNFVEPLKSRGLRVLSS